MAEKKAALFFDIDGTVISISDHEVPKSAEKALAMAQKNGHKIFINTGRALCELPDNIRNLAFDGYLCACGSYLIYHDQVLLSEVLPKDRGYYYLDEMKRCNIECLLQGIEDMYFSEKPCRFEWLKKERRKVSPMGLGMKTPIEKRHYTYQKMMICTDAKSDKERFFQVISDYLIPIDMGNGVYECIQKNYSKATAIEYMQNYLGIDKDQIYVFGDSGNDLTMFKYADHAIAMKDHDPVLDPYAEYVTDTVENDGLYKALVHYGFIDI